MTIISYASSTTRTRCLTLLIMPRTEGVSSRVRWRCRLLRPSPFKVASWSAPVPRNVLYIDGEMALDGLLERDRALSGGQGSKEPCKRSFAQAPLYHKDRSQVPGAALESHTPHGSGNAPHSLCRLS